MSGTPTSRRRITVSEGHCIVSQSTCPRQSLFEVVLSIVRAPSAILTFPAPIRLPQPTCSVDYCEAHSQHTMQPVSHGAKQRVPPKSIESKIPARRQRCTGVPDSALTCLTMSTGELYGARRSPATGATKHTVYRKYPLSALPTVTTASSDHGRQVCL